MLSAIWERRLVVGTGLLGGVVCWLLIHASTDSAFVTPAAALAGGFAANLARSSRQRAADAGRDDLFASLFGSLLAALALHTAAQGGLL